MYEKLLTMHLAVGPAVVVRSLPHEVDAKALVRPAQRAGTHGRQLLAQLRRHLARVRVMG
jgi:hypothetical protein